MKRINQQKPNRRIIFRIIRNERASAWPLDFKKFTCNQTESISWILSTEIIDDSRKTNRGIVLSFSTELYIEYQVLCLLGVS